jgi:photosystem II stability/assembly factor-like uncharacterized protein
MLSSTKSRSAGKTLLQTLFFVLLVTQICFTQWVQQFIGTVDRLQGVSFVDSNTGWVVSGLIDSSFVFKTSNGGSTWTKQIGLTGDNRLVGISFQDTSTGIAVGGEWSGGGGAECIACSWSIKGIILLTNDGGVSWEMVSSDSTQYLTSVTFKDEENGWAVGGNYISCGLPMPYDSTSAVILHTSDGGRTWISQYVDSLQNGFIQFQDIFFTDTENGTVVGGRRIFRTTNGGETWTRQASWTDSLLFLSLNSACFLDENTGFVFGSDWNNSEWYHVLLKTSDGGEIWTVQQFSVNVRDAVFIGADKIIAVGDSGKILLTTNGGESWTSQSSGTTNTLFCISFSDTNNGWAGGENGTILHTTNGGVTFVEEKEINRVPTEYNLSNNFPNPFNPSTKIKYSIPQSSNVIIKVFDVLGNEIETLVNEEKSSGTYELTWNAASQPSGVYFYQLKAVDPSTGSGQSFISTKKMILLK